jgi:hypothetical protein
VELFRSGLGAELEHGRRDATNVTADDRGTTGKIGELDARE